MPYLVRENLFLTATSAMRRRLSEMAAKRSHIFSVQFPQRKSRRQGFEAGEDGGSAKKYGR
ncbi:hypothetical protein Pyn_26908 [Prunus yedoensis var. nudiflora]|uniref:Uncharacterized protein n=1 Tax=Prunus yedoensis var. nudiflora TaxID=2094558 RepID=A0A314ZHG4_PRUYE|nr:hypothetical protein Pyn_26908 [Prunus yedoensis var. nudiflora]